MSLVEIFPDAYYFYQNTQVFLKESVQTQYYKFYERLVFPYLKYMCYFSSMDNDNSNHPERKRRYKPIKLSDLMIRTLRSVLTALQAMSEYAKFCNNPNCRSLITFHANEVRPILCSGCGKHIDWGDSMTVGTCPKCNEEFNINNVYCPFHSPPVLLEEKRARLYPSSSGGDDDPPVGF